MRNLDTNLYAALDHYRDRGDPVALATIIATAGSTYRKAGARMLIDRDGKYFGLLGGGCFEGDLVEHAAGVIASGRGKVVSYDLRAGSEAIWGLGLGCNGAVRILLQRVDNENEYQPAAFLAKQRAGGRDALVASIAESSHSEDLGKSICLDDNLQVIFSQLSEQTGIAVSRYATQSLAGQDHGVLTHDNCKIYCERIARPRRLLILGAGPDAQPLAYIALALGWQVTVTDHRPAYIEDWSANAGLKIFLAEDAGLDDSVLQYEYDAALVMSHNFEIDADYLQQLAGHRLTYIGVLGPAHRKKHLLEMMSQESAASLHGKLFGPVGLDIGAESPESIALSVLAEIHCVLEHSGSGHMGAPVNKNKQDKLRA